MTSTRTRNAWITLGLAGIAAVVLGSLATGPAPTHAATPTASAATATKTVAPAATPTKPAAASTPTKAAAPTTAGAPTAKLPKTGDGTGAGGSASLWWGSAALSAAGAAALGLALWPRRRAR